MLLLQKLAYLGASNSLQLSTPVSGETYNLYVTETASFINGLLFDNSATK